MVSWAVALVMGHFPSPSRTHRQGRLRPIRRLTLVFPGFLAPVLLSSGIRRIFSLTCTPQRADVAAREIRKKKTEHISDQAQRTKIDQIEDAAQTAEYHDVLQ